MPPSDVKQFVGEPTRVTFDPSDIHVFDRSDGDNQLVNDRERTAISDEQTI